VTINSIEGVLRVLNECADRLFDAEACHNDVPFWTSVRDARAYLATVTVVPSPTSAEPTGSSAPPSELVEELREAARATVDAYKDRFVDGTFKVERWLGPIDREVKTLDAILNKWEDKTP
jgi:hypothetical protein